MLRFSRKCYSSIVIRLQSFRRSIAPTHSIVTPMVSRSEILSLFRSLHRTARQFPDYNVREYIKRRASDGFRLNRDITDPTSAFAKGKAQLEVAKRQAVVYSLYAPKVKSIMELKI